jgi:hypothetical protein
MVILIIRHCDKPTDDNNPCCSKKGYERAEYWKRYFQHYNNLTTYTAGFRTRPDQCLKDFPFNSNHKCQHSQRMLLTSYIIGKPIRSGYCVGDEKKLVRDLNKDENSLIVWEHDGISKILRLLNVKYPYKIDSSRYDQVITINYDKLLSTNFRRQHDNNNNIPVSWKIWMFIVIIGGGIWRLYNRRRDYQSINH